MTPWRLLSARRAELGKRRRADELLVERGLCESATEAAQFIMAGKVLSGSERIDKAGQLLDADAPLRLKQELPFVSRGGLKLAHALERFAIDPADAVALDAGASTGGFTDCLLQRGAARVYAVDVAYGQFAWELRNDERVVLMERTNIRDVAEDELDPRPDLIVADLSFVSLTTILPVLTRLAADGAKLVVLVKPQFEVDPEHLDKGVVKDPEARSAAVAGVEEAARSLGLICRGEVESPVTGRDGNHEYFLYLEKPAA